MNTTSLYSQCDASLGPTATDCGTDSRFDFTVAFELSALSITPYAVFLSAAVPRLVHLWTHSRKVAGKPLHVLKLASHSNFHNIMMESN